MVFISFLFIFIIFVLFDYFFFKRIFLNLFRIKFLSENFSLAISAKLMSLVFLTTFTMMVFSSSISTLSSLFLDKELEFLYSLPLKRWIVKGKALIESFVASSVMVFFLVLPTIFAFYSVKKESFFLPLVSFVSLIFFFLSPLFLGSTITVLLARFFPAKRLHQFLTLLGMTLFALLIIFIRLARPENLLNPKEAVNYEKIISSINLPQENSLPSTWIARAVVSAGLNDKRRFFNYSQKTFNFCITSFLMLLIVIKLFYLKGYLRAKEELTNKSKNNKFENLIFSILNKFPLNKDIKALFYKDFLNFFRSPSEWGQLFMLSALIVVYVFNIKFLPKEIETFKVAVTLLNFATLSFVVASIAARFTFPSISMEGEGFYLIKSLPYKTKMLILSKFLFSFVPITLISFLIFFISVRFINLKGISYYYFLFLIIPTSLFICSLAIFFGSLNPNFKEKNPNKILVSFEGFQYMFFSMLYIGISIILSAKPVYYYYISFFYDEIFQIFSKYFIIIFALSLTFVFLLHISTKRVEKIERI